MSAPFARWLRDGYDRRSAIALAVLFGTYSSIGYSYRNLIHPERGMDWLLAGTWVLLTGLVIWRVRPADDVLMLGAGLAGGAVIEWWGTNTLLWSYFTDERPPLWILPAWPIAALAVDRLAQIVDRAIPAIARAGRAWWVVAPAFVAWMTWFLWPTVQETASQVVVATMLVVVVYRARPGRDLVIFVAGAMMGVFLEYWGTSRLCWTYYTEQVPPPVAIFAHGFAGVAFARVRDQAWSSLGALRKLSAGRRNARD